MNDAVWVNDPASSLWNFIRILVAEPLTAFTCIRPHKYETFPKKKKNYVEPGSTSRRHKLNSEESRLIRF